MTTKLPQADVSAERSTLGAILIDKPAFAKCSEYLTPESFYDNRHATIYRAMMDLDSQNKPIDLVTVEAGLTKRKEIDGVGQYFLMDLDCPFPRNVETYAKIVQNKYLLRKFAEISDKSSEASYKPEAKLDDLLDTSIQNLFALQQGTSTEGFESQENMGVDVVKAIQSEDPTGVMSGYSEIDEMLGGFQNSDLIILAARPSMGKTALALNIAGNVLRLSKGTKDGSGTIGFFSVEMALRPIQYRLMAHWSMVPLWKVIKRKLNDSDMRAIGGAVKEKPFKNIHIDAGVQTMSSIRSRARKLASTTNLKMIIIDYLQLIITPGKTESQNIAIGEISRGLKLLAKELNIPIVCLSQLSRGLENRPNKRPMLSDLRDSGSIEQDADVVMFVYRQSYYDNIGKRFDDPEYSNDTTSEIIIAKQRNGPTGVARLSWNKDIAGFNNIEQPF